MFVFIWGAGKMVIPAPMEVEEIMKKVPRGKVITIKNEYPVLRSTSSRPFEIPKLLQK